MLTVTVYNITTIKLWKYFFVSYVYLIISPFRDNILVSFALQIGVDPYLIEIWNYF